jgi:uncharacterized protein
MLIDFTVQNFRSIKEPVTLSAVASTHKRNTLDDKIAKPFSLPQRKLEILPVLGIFGANASGKSNVINALGQLLDLVIHPNNLDEQVIRSSASSIKPFLLNSSTSKNPTKFKLRIVLNGNIYSYYLSIFQDRVLQERLEYIPIALERVSSRLIFDRVWNNKLMSYSVENGKQFGETYKEIQLSVKKSRTFLGVLAMNFDIEFLIPIVGWFVSSRTTNTVNPRLVADVNTDDFESYFSCLMIETFKGKFSSLETKIFRIMRKFDVGIEDIEIKKVKKKSVQEEYEVRIIHKTDKGTVNWLLAEESLGTKKLFSLAVRLFLTFEMGGLMLVDELGASTHPNINREIVKLFQNERLNKNHAQLIFTSHDSSLQRKGILRRDQTWYTQKLEDGSTDLYSLSDYGVRNDLATEKAYLDGRFKAVPFSPSEREVEEIFEVN